MRRSGSKGRKTSNNEESAKSFSNSYVPLKMELDLIAMKANNTDLTKVNAKLVRENYEYKNEIISLRKDLLDSESKYNRLEIEFRKLCQEMKRCTPSLIEILNLFLQVNDVPTSRPSSNRLSGLSSKGHTPQTKATHTVKPHTVNGTVLNLNPTISLTRMPPRNSQQNEPSSSSPDVIDYNNSLPSTSTNGECDLHNDRITDSFGDDSSENPNTTTNGELFVVIPRQANSEDLSGLEAAEEEEELTPASDVPSANQLSTIAEESILSSPKNSLGNNNEVKVHLKRLSQKDMSSRNNESGSSITANANDTCLNIETTVIENQDPLSKTASSDKMLFSPRSNSTLVYRDSFIFENVSPTRRRSVPRVSVIQSTEVTPTSPRSRYINENTITPESTSPMPFPTPSMSAMGDINKSNYSRPDILNESARTNISPLCESSPRSRRTAIRKRSRGDSPVAARTSLVSRRPVSSFVSRQRGGSVETVSSPTVIIERLEPPQMERMRTRSSPIYTTDNSKENEDVDDNRVSNANSRTKRSKKKNTRSKSPKRNAKRKKTDESDELQQKIREVQIRLSHYVPPNDELDDAAQPCSPTKCSKRPSRAAKPKVLKDASLKAKMRRMF